MCVRVFSVLTQIVTMAMTAHPNGSVLNAIRTLCVLMFVSSARGQQLLETIASLCLGQCVCVCMHVHVQGISWALKHFRANHLSLFLSLQQLFFLSSVLSVLSSFHPVLCFTFSQLLSSHLSFLDLLVFTLFPSSIGSSFLIYWHFALSSLSPHLSLFPP